MKPRKKPTPWIVSSGFVALDVVLGIEDPDCARFYSGGTSGNVSASMAFLGWKSSPVARLAEDEAGAFVRADLNRWGVDTSFLGTASTCPTPIVVQKIFVGKDGTPKHRFLWNCPDCGAYFPSFRPVLGESVPGIAALIEKPTVFFTDRISKSSLKLAEHCKEAGAAIVFEPSGVGDPTQFVRMLGICDILKYSDQRAKSFSDLLHNNRVLLEIQTLGEEGLRFILRTPRASKNWTQSPSHDVKVVDTAGAGDWTTAGLIAHLLADGSESLKRLTKEKVLDALNYAQALAAINCQFEGARGAMYQLPRETFLTQAMRLSKKQSSGRTLRDENSNGINALSQRVCPSCIETSLADENPKKAVLDRA
jgi:sugar/nucleoside kinase (ribokinase family)